MNRLCFSVVLWGKPFVELFTRYVLPSHLAAHNIPALTLNHMSEYVIVTTQADMEALARAPAIARLASYMPVRYIVGSFGAADIASPIKYTWLTEAHTHLLGYARERDAGLLFLTPDTLLSDGSLARIEAGIRAGQRAVVVTGLMVDHTRFLPALDDYLTGAGRSGEVARGSLSAEARPLMRLATRTYHHIVDAYRVDSTTFNHFPSFIYWRLGERGMLVRAFHLHPIFVYPEDWDTPIYTDKFQTIDQTYVTRAVRDVSRIDLPTDSDEFLLLELAPPEKAYPVYDRSFAVPRKIGAWAGRETEVLNWAFFRHKLWFHTGIDRTQFVAVEAASDEFVGETLRYAVAARQAIAAAVADASSRR